MSDYTYGQAYYTPPQTAGKVAPPSNFKSGAGPSGYKYGSAYGTDQSMRAVNEDDVVAGAMNEHKGTLVIHNDPTKLPKFGTQMAGSLPTDIETKARYLAKAIFPDLPEDQAMARMGSDNGRLYYIDQDNKAYYAEPSFDPIAAPGRTIAELPDMAASNIGPALPVVGGMVGGATTSGFGGGIPGAAAGGAVGDVIRQAGAHFITGEEKPLTERVLQTAQEAGQQGLGQAIGLGVAKGAGAAFGRNPLKVSGYDASRLTPSRISQIEANIQKARRLGVTVTPGEAGNVTSLLQRQRIIGRQPEAATTMGDFQNLRNIDQLPAGWKQTMDQISPVSAPGIGARNLADASKAVVKDAVKTQKNLAGPKYKAVVNETNVLPPERFAPLMEDDVIKTAFKSVRSDKILNSDIKAAPNESLLVLNEVKKRLDSMYNAAKLKGDFNRTRILDNARTKLLDTLDEVFPDYKPARQAFAGEIPQIDALKKGLVGLVAKDRSAGWQNAPRTMFDFNSADEISIRQARTAFEKAGKTSEWNAGIRSFLDNAFSAAAKEKQGPASNILQTLKQNDRQWRILKAATTPTQMRALEDFMDVAEMVARAPKEGAATATDIGGRAGFVGPVAKGTSNLVKGLNPFSIPERIGNWIEDVSAGRNADAMAKLITSPDAMSSLRRLKVLTPGSEKFIAELTYFGEALGMSQVGFQPPDKLPAAAR